MSNMKQYLYLIVIIVLFSISGCVKDDSPYPNVAGTSWKWSDGDSIQKLSFTDNKVTHIIIEDNDTIYTYTGKYCGGSSFGEHFYTWDNEGNGLRYKVYSYGRKHIMMTREFSPSYGAPTVEEQKAIYYDRYYCFAKE